MADIEDQEVAEVYEECEKLASELGVPPPEKSMYDNPFKLIVNSHLYFLQTLKFLGIDKRGT